jgi:hypothetical protein
MGMDVYGKNPTTEGGEYFRNNVHAWVSLAEYIYEAAPDIAIKCRHWHYNDGDGLDAADAIKLADRLRDEIDSGRCEDYARRTCDDRPWDRELCNVLDQAGVPALPGMDYVLTGRDFHVSNVRNFVAFLRGCGGFEIW